jgi:aerobic carbon-monoxide dehydrogenase large subunit
MWSCLTASSSRMSSGSSIRSHGQAIGGAVQGLGGAFLEDLVYDGNGQLLAGNLADYLIPTATDFPRLRAIALENHPSPSNPLGVKGAGEGAIIPMGGLMANAVANALTSFGAMPNHLPLSPARIWRMGGAVGVTVGCFGSAAAPSGLRAESHARRRN